MITIYKPDGTPVRMDAVDAREAVKFCDYSYDKPSQDAAESETEKDAAESETEKDAVESETEKDAAESETEKPAEPAPAKRTRTLKSS